MSNPKKQGKKIGQVLHFENKGYQITKVAKNVQFFIIFLGFLALWVISFEQQLRHGNKLSAQMWEK